MFAALWWPRFRLQAALRWRETTGPVALVDAEASKGVVLEVNDAAEAWRVQAGLTPAQALARCPDLQIVLRSPAQEAACQTLQVELAMGFSPEVEVTWAGLCTLDLNSAPKGACWQKMGEAMVSRAAAEGFQARVGMAPHPDHAWLAACRAVPVNVVYDGAPFCATLPMSVLEPSEALGAILDDWGIRTVGEFLKLPAQAVIERLGPEAAQLRRRVSGRSKRVLRLERPAERFSEAFDFEYAIETTEPLLFLLRRFVDALAGRLRGTHRVASGLSLVLVLDGAAEYRRMFSIPSPTADADVWFRILSTHLEALTLEQQPIGVRLEVHASDPAGRQLNLFESALRDPNRFGETLAQLKALVGEKGVGVPQHADTHRPGAFRLDEFSEATGSPLESRLRGLPLRRLRPRRSVLVKESDGRPAWLDGPIVAVRGPYRLSGQWWENHWDLTEWDVETGDGRTLRLAKWPDETWTMEGEYDVL